MNTDTLRHIHDILKNHPYRLYFSEDDEEDYKDYLYKLAEAWENIIYNQKHDDITSKKLKQFGNWLHDYKSILTRRKGSDRYWTNYFTYYEAMLQLTHLFLDTGDFDTYYYPNIQKDANGNIYAVFNTYKYITKEDCPIDSKYIPGYFCMTTPYNIDDETMLNVFKRFFSAELANEKFKEWQQQEKPIWEYANLLQELKNV